MSLLEDPSTVLSLETIRSTLIRLEDTIIFSLIERAQFAYNKKIYTKDAFKDVLHSEQFQGSWLDWMLKETEAMHAKVRRYESPDEHPFTPRRELPAPLLPALEYPDLLRQPHEINVNSKIMRFYTQDIVPALTKEADDSNYGSSATRDIEVLQAMSRRIHYGMFVSESKFRSCPADFVPHILNPNPEELLKLITKPAVEAALLVRLDKKARWYGGELDAQGQVQENKMKLNVACIVGLYRDWIIPLTKEVEVEYLLHRLDGLSQDEIEKLGTTRESIL